ncbi:pectin acetylesterase 5-like isoform X1 [Hordeum vulgare subsp. vulgare]|uniref:pectin acetylesterase 5-like isoform X1 n=1 Tax=Hordeum vulgare subsp. vulgare TaxID=112509 RepID=UPI001D1A346D|nr:pectin acetylesterase 5-like isoform X1 [Hordeum vulgare subsp. vulgare]XP_044946581.1 pectin acetylesterase 5-like isoform X1 [Hordeum vulgare subsp. vulgare]XP_044946582.1 pectin acetylesterase 5-like isoform X1 [Hordeum vulgare subsp. vulgare]
MRPRPDPHPPTTARCRPSPPVFPSCIPSPPPPPPPRRRTTGAAAFAFALLAAAFFLTPCRDASAPSSTSYPSYGHRLPTLVDLTLIAGAREKSVVCLDGTPPGYHWLPGFGEGSDKWLLHLEGGSWCRNLTWCAQRKETNLGSSDHMERRVEFVGILSDDELQNPDFYNWNKVKVRYCDGASFSGNFEEEFQDGTRFFFRGQRIWDEVMRELLSKGLSHAKEAFLTGCSGGGLSTYIHCDDFRALVPKVSTIKCLADGGFFLDVEDICGRRYMRGFYNDVASLQDLRKKFPHCSTDMEPGQSLQRSFTFRAWYPGDGGQDHLHGHKCLSCYRWPQQVAGLPVPR